MRVFIYIEDSSQLASVCVHFNFTRVTSLIKCPLETYELLFHAAITEWVVKWKRNGWQTAQAEPVKNKEDIMRLDSACQRINVKWVSTGYIEMCICEANSG